MTDGDERVQRVKDWILGYDLKCPDHKDFNLLIQLIDGGATLVYCPLAASHIQPVEARCPFLVQLPDSVREGC